MVKGLTITFLALMLVACMPWPKQGTGEKGNLTDSPMVRFTPREVDPKQYPTEIAILQMRLMLAQNFLQDLRAQGFERCFPAAYQQAETQSNRTAKEIAGGLYLDAANDVLILEKYVNQAYNRFNYVNDKVDCSTFLGKNAPLPAHLQAERRQLETIINTAANS